MDVGMIGLGKMGSNMAKRLLEGGHRVVVNDRNPDAVVASAEDGAEPANSLEALVQILDPPRAVWMMVPAGEATEGLVAQLSDLLREGDVLVDGANSNYKDTIRRAEFLASGSIHYVDAGVSGGVWGLTEGYSLMIGGHPEAVDTLRPVFETLAPEPDKGWGHVGPTGAGHFVKMVHNGIEYGLMQAYAEGFEILRAKESFNLDLHQIAEVWRFGSVVRSWLLDLTARALAEDAGLDRIEGYVEDSGEGRWTVAEAIDLDIPAPVITTSLLMRFVSRQDNAFAPRLLASLRNQFGGHAVEEVEDVE